MGYMRGRSGLDILVFDTQQWLGRRPRTADMPGVLAPDAGFVMTLWRPRGANDKVVVADCLYLSSQQNIYLPLWTENRRIVVKLQSHRATGPLPW